SLFGFLFREDVSAAQADGSQSVIVGIADRRQWRAIVKLPQLCREIVARVRNGMQDLRAIQCLPGLRVVCGPILSERMGRNGHASLPVYLLDGAGRGLSPIDGGLD